MAYIQGYDCSISITGSSGPVLVGLYQEAEITIKEDTEKYLGMGERIAENLDGPIEITGKLKKGHTNLAIIKEIWGQSSLKRGEAIAPSPRFTVTLNINAKSKGYEGKYKLLNVKFDNLSIKAKEGKDILSEDLDFKAEGIE